MSRLNIKNCSLDDDEIAAIAASVNKINQLEIRYCRGISVEGWTELAKHISNRKSPVSS